MYFLKKDERRRRNTYTKDNVYYHGCYKDVTIY